MNGARGKKADSTVTVKLAFNAGVELGLAAGSLVWTKLIIAALGRHLRPPLDVSKGKVVLPTGLEGTGLGVFCAVSDGVAGSEELISADLETVVAGLAGLAVVGAASVDERPARQ